MQQPGVLEAAMAQNPQMRQLLDADPRLRYPDFPATSMEVPVCMLSLSKGCDAAAKLRG
jgi:hypothetical protein